MRKHSAQVKAMSKDLNRNKSENGKNTEFTIGIEKTLLGGNYDEQLQQIKNSFAYKNNKLK